MVSVYKKENGLTEVNSSEEALQRLHINQFILKEGTTYVRLKQVEGLTIFVRILDENLFLVNNGVYAWAMKNNWLQSNVLPYARRILKTNSNNNRVWKITFKNGEITSVEQLVSNNKRIHRWHPIREDVQGIYETHPGHFSVISSTSCSISVGTVFSIKTAIKLKKYFLKKGCPDWMRAVTKQSYFARELDDLFSDYARKWDASFDNDVKLLYDNQSDEIGNDMCSLDSLMNDSEHEQVVTCVDECDLILQVLRDLKELDKTSFREQLDYGNLQRELSRIYGEKQVQKIIGGTI